MTRDRDRPLPPGVYDAPITLELDAALSAHDPSLRDVEALDPSERPRALARLVQNRMAHALASFPTSGERKNEALDRQLSLTNQVLALLETVDDSGATPEQHMAPPTKNR